MKRILPLFIAFLSVVSLSAQIGSNEVYEFLNLSPSARITALGGSQIAVKDDDVALAYENPGLLNPLMDKQLSFNYNFYVADINSGYAAYGHHLQSLDMTIHGGIHFINYGQFDLTNEFGQQLGNFNAAEYAITLGAGRQLYEKLSVGANIKFITSQFESYNSNGLALDLGAYYQDTSSNFSAALVIKNIGGQLTPYVDENREPIPFEVKFGIAQRLQHLPFRFSITYNSLDRWNILFDDPDAVDETVLLGETAAQERSWLSVNSDNFFRHLTFGGEFLFGKKENFRLRVGYNHLRRAELKVANFRSLAGFSFGAGIKVSKFRIEYGQAIYHLAGGVNHLSISTNINSFLK